MMNNLKILKHFLIKNKFLKLISKKYQKMKRMVLKKIKFVLVQNLHI